MGAFCATAYRADLSDTRLDANARPQRILVEDAVTGTALVQELREEIYGIIPVKPVGDKVTRMAVASAKIEAAELSRELGSGQTKVRRTSLRVQAAVAARQFCNASPLRTRSVLRETRWR